jgi:hypothetical protein
VAAFAAAACEAAADCAEAADADAAALVATTAVVLTAERRATPATLTGVAGWPTRACASPTRPKLMGESGMSSAAGTSSIDPATSMLAEIFILGS